jgi:hypothetical protein
MNWPSCAGWLNIAGVFLNMLGVLTLFYFRFEVFGGWERGRLPPEDPRSWQAKAKRNLARVPWQRVGVVCIAAGWLVQAVAQFVP